MKESLFLIVVHDDCPTAASGGGRCWSTASSRSACLDQMGKQASDQGDAAALRLLQGYAECARLNSADKKRLRAV